MFSLRLTVVLERAVGGDKRLVDFFGDSSRRCLTVTVLMALLADLDLLLCPLFELVTHPVSLNFRRRLLIPQEFYFLLEPRVLLFLKQARVYLTDFFRESQLRIVAESGSPILIQSFHNLYSLLYIILFLIHCGENSVFCC